MRHGLTCTPTIANRARSALVSASTLVTCSSMSAYLFQCEGGRGCVLPRFGSALGSFNFKSHFVVSSRLCRKMCSASEPAGIWMTLQESLHDVCIHLLLLVQPVPLEKGNRYNLPPHR